MQNRQGKSFIQFLLLPQTKEKYSRTKLKKHNVSQPMKDTYYTDITE